MSNDGADYYDHLDFKYYPAITIVGSEVSESGYMEYKLPNGPTWSNFDAFVGYLVDEYKAEIVKFRDGIWTRDYVLLISGVELHVKHEEMRGNWFYTKSKTKNELLETIAKDAYRLTKDIPVPDAEKYKS